MALRGTGRGPVGAADWAGKDPPATLRVAIRARCRRSQVRTDIRPDPTKMRVRRTLELAFCDRAEARRPDGSGGKVEARAALSTSETSDQNRPKLTIDAILKMALRDHRSPSAGCRRERAGSPRYPFTSRNPNLRPNPTNLMNPRQRKFRPRRPAAGCRRRQAGSLRSISHLRIPDLSDQIRPLRRAARDEGRGGKGPPSLDSRPHNP